MYQKKVDEVCFIELNTLEKQILHLPRFLPGCMILGGAPLAIYLNKKELINDWDLFFTTNEAQNTAMSIIEKLGFSLIDDTVNSYTYINDKLKVQVIKPIQLDCFSTFSYFDLTVCCIGIIEDYIMMRDEIKIDIDAREINVVCLANPTSLIERLIRYGVKGFKPSVKCLKDIIYFLQVANPEEIKEYRTRMY